MKTIIVMNQNKSLQITSLIPSFKNEKNADELLFLLPQYYGDINITDMTLNLNWINEKGDGNILNLTLLEDLYDDIYFQSKVTLDATFTQISGNIEIWISLIQAEKEIIAKTNIIKLPIYDHKDVSDIIIEKNQNIIEQLQTKVIQLSDTAKKLDESINYMYSSIPTLDEINALFTQIVETQGGD